MRRRYWMVLALALSACSHPPRAPESLLPASVGGAWVRTSLHAEAPPKPGLRRTLHAAYQGAGKLTVDLFETTSPGTAFEMTQHWKALPDAVCFDKGRYFAVVKWERADRQALTGFVRGLEKNLED